MSTCVRGLAMQAVEHKRQHCQRCQHMREEAAQHNGAHGGNRDRGLLPLPDGLRERLQAQRSLSARHTSCSRLALGLH